MERDSPLPISPFSTSSPVHFLFGLPITHGVNFLSLKLLVGESVSLLMQSGHQYIDQTWAGESKVIGQLQHAHTLYILVTAWCISQLHPVVPSVCRELKNFLSWRLLCSQLTKFRFSWIHILLSLSGVRLLFYAFLLQLKPDSGAKV